jgi:hypothetical protein
VLRRKLPNILPDVNERSVNATSFTPTTWRSRNSLGLKKRVEDMQMVPFLWMRDVGRRWVLLMTRAVRNKVTAEKVLEELKGFTRLD